MLIHFSNVFLVLVVFDVSNATNQKLAPNDFALSTVNWVSCMITRTFGISLVASSIKYFFSSGVNNVCLLVFIKRQ